MSTLTDAIIDALEEFLTLLFSPIEEVVERYADDLLRIVVETPYPNAVFDAPTNEPWPAIHAYYWDTIIPLSLSLWALSIGVVIFLESASNLFSNYHRSKLKKRAFVGLIGILSWWWIAAISLRFIDALSEFLLPSLSDISLFQTLSFSAMGILGIAIALSTNLVLFVLIALIYFIRQVVLYLFVLLMPILIALWIPGTGPFTHVSRFMQQFAGLYVPFLFMTVPVAMLFRLGGLLGESFSLSMGGFGAWLTALVIPIVAVVSPFILFWQAGSLFFMAGRASTHTSSRRARERAILAREGAQRTAHGGRNFTRGLRGDAPVTRNGQTTLGSETSRAHRAGSRLGSARTHLSGLGDRFDRGEDRGEANGPVIVEDRSSSFQNLRSPPQLPPANLPQLPPTTSRESREQRGRQMSRAGNEGGDESTATSEDTRRTQ